MASRPLRGSGDGPRARPRRRARAARRRARSPRRSASSPSWARWRRRRRSWPRPSPTLEFRVWSGPVEGRVRIASPYRLRAGPLRPRLRRLAAGRRVPAPRPRRRPLPLGSPAGDARPRAAPRQRSRGALPVPGLPGAAAAPAPPLLPRQRRERRRRGALALPRRRAGAAGAGARRLGPRPGRGGDHPRPRPGPGRRAAGRGALGERAGAGRSPPTAAAPRRRALLGRRSASMPGAAAPDRDPDRRRRGVAEAASRAPGPLTNPAVLESLAAVRAYGGTTLEEFDVCSYRWFAGHELDPQPLDPVPDPLVQGGLMHAALDRLYRERPGGDPLPQAASLPAWSARGRQLVAEIAAERELGSHPAERAMVRRVERLLDRFLERRGRTRHRRLRAVAAGGRLRRARGGRAADPGARTAGACTGRSTGSTATPTAAPSSSTTSSPGAVTPREKFEEQAKLQLPLYLLAAARALGRDAGRRPLPPAARAPRCGARAGSSSRRSPVTWPATTSTPRTWSRTRCFEELLEDSRRARRRDRRPHARRRDPPRPRPSRAACAATTSAPPSAPSRRSAAATAPPSTKRTRTWRSDERAPTAARFACTTLVPRNRAAGGGPVSGRTPTPEQAAAIEVGGRDVLLEAGAGTGKTGVMVDRYCRLVVDEGVSPDAILAFTFTDKAAAELRAADPAGAGRPGRGRLRARRRAAERDRRRLDHDDPRLLQPPPRRPPGRRRRRSRLPRARRPGGGAGRPRGLRRGAGGVPRRGPGARPRGAWSPPSRSTGCGRSSAPSTPSCAAAARPSRGCRSRRRATPSRRSRRRSKRRARRWRRCARATPNASWSSGRWPGSAPPGPDPGLDELWALRTSSRAKAIAPYREAIDAAIARSAEAGEGGEAYRHLGELLRLFSARFEAAKERRAGIDFEDLQILAARLLERAEIGEAYRARFSHLLVDEFQDTNRLQLRLIEALRGPRSELVVVGDELQSIYGFRHADLDVFRRSGGGSSSAPTPS